MPDRVDHARSRALIIATTVSADPGIPVMPTAAGSLAGMREVLTDAALCGWPGASVTSVRDNSDPRALLRILRTLAGEAEETLLVHFAGPGILLSHSKLCLGLADTRLHDAEDSSLPYTQVRGAVLKSRARLKVVILDCSYSGRVIPGPPAIRVAELTSISETYVLTVSDREADPGNAAASAFTAELAATIRAGIPCGPPTLTLDDLYPRLADRLRQAGRPAPNRESTGLAGQLPFTRNASHGPPVPPQAGAILKRRAALSRRQVVAMAGGVAVIAGTGGAIAASGSPLHAKPRARLTATVSPPASPPGEGVKAQLSGSGDPVTRLAFTLDGRYLIGSSGVTGKRPAASLQLWDLTQPLRPATPLEHGSTLHGIALHPDGVHFATAGDDGAVRLWDLTHLTTRPRLICTHEHNAWDVAFSPDGSVLASSSSDRRGLGKGRTVILSNVSSGKTQAVMPHPDSVSGLAFAPADAVPKSRQILVTGCKDHLVRVWDTTLAPLGHIPLLMKLYGHTEAVSQVVFRPKGRGMFATGGWDATLRLWNLTSTRPVHTFEKGLAPETVTSVAFSPGGQTVAGACANSVYLWDIRTLGQKPPLPSNSTAGVAYNQAGTLLASTSRGIVLLRRAR
jgi:Caspase domain/WD domain, G-beta repeat